MRKTVFVLLVTLLFSAIAYTIQAALSREVTEINMPTPEGIVTVIYEEVVADPPRNDIPQDAEILVEVEIIEVSEGVITVTTEMVAPDLSGTQENGNLSDEDVSEQLQHLQDSLIRLQQEAEEVK